MKHIDGIILSVRDELEKTGFFEKFNAFKMATVLIMNYKNTSSHLIKSLGALCGHLTTLLNHDSQNKLKVHPIDQMKLTEISKSLEKLIEQIKKALDEIEKIKSSNLKQILSFITEPLSELSQKLNNT